MAGSGEENSCNGSDFSRIEELIKGNTFSREEISRLLEILNSKTENELDMQKTASDDGKDAQMVLHTDEVLRIPSQERQQDFLRAKTVRFRENADGPSEVGASPIDIARAYMANCASEGGYEKYKFMSKNKQTPPSTFSSGKPFSPSPSPKPLVCWPGAVLHDHSTPQGQSGRQRIHEFTRSPYSRSILAKSTTKFPVDGRYENPSTPFQQSQTSPYRQEKSSFETVGAYGSVGPIRRIRSKFASEVPPRLSTFSSSAKQGPSRTVAPQASEGFMSGKRKNLEHDESPGAVSDMDIAHKKVSSSRAVRTILEHLDRVKPTPKENEAELQLATSWRRSFATDAVNVENGNSIHIQEPSSDLDSRKNGPSFYQGISKDIKSKSKLVVDSVNNDVYEAKDGGKGKAIASDADSSASGLLHGAGFAPPFALSKGSLAGFEPSFAPSSSFDLEKSSHQAATNSIFSRAQRSNSQDRKTAAADSDLLKNHGMKPSLPSLEISRPKFGAASAGNGPATFSFPLSASSGLLSDPPTPSIFRSSSASTSLSVPALGPVPGTPSYTFGTSNSTPRIVFSSSASTSVSVPATPSYTFGTSGSTPRLVFSFPWTSNASTTQDASDPKFKFGSENNARLSFASLGKDAVCC